MDAFHFAVFESSMGNIVLVAKNGKLISLDVRTEGLREVRKSVVGLYPDTMESEVPFKMIRTLLDRYLRGTEVEFDVETDLSGLGVFTQKVLTELKKIPYGDVKSYGWLAKKLDYKGAARAVGQALKRNPIPIIIPCHRIIREDGSIGGFSMGLRIKERLLALEGVNLRGQRLVRGRE
jgi:methylated-DNA-[protein]-cysteine S-methyltransferase